MDRRQFVVAVAALASSRVAFAQKTPVIGLLWNDSVKPSPYVTVLEVALKERGYMPGRDLRFEDAVALEGYTPMAANAARLVSSKVDVVMAYGATATLAAAKATRDIPIIMIIGADPVASGLAKSLSRPGGNVTGVWTLNAGLTRKRVELLKQLTPRASRIGVLYAPSTAVQSALDDAASAASALKMATVKSEVKTPDQIEAAVAKLAHARVHGIFVTGSTMLAAHSESVVESIARHRIPAIYGTERYIGAGGLMIYSPSIRRAFDHAALYVDRLLRGGRAAEMPIEQVSDVELVVNLKAARQQGIKLPQSILQRADRAIE